MMQMAQPRIGRPLLKVDTLPRYVAELPRAPVARPSGTCPDPEHPAGRAPFYDVRMCQSQQRLHPALPPTKVWTYAQGSNAGTFPGPVFYAKKGEPMLVRWSNDLPRKHFLPIDHSLCGAEIENPEVRTVTHLHGAKVPHKYDGFPENWYPVGHSATYRYHNGQDAATLWYHDHAMGINRLNSYAGMMGMYLLRDENEEGLALPSDEFEVPVVIADRMLDAESQLFYPVSGDPRSPWVPEFFGNVVTLNGAVWPKFEAQPRPYRFRFLNASNGSIVHLNFDNKRVMYQIGTDQGLMAAPAETDMLTIAPGERVDVILDFGADAGKTFLLNDLVSPILQVSVANGVPERVNLPQKLRTMEFLNESAAMRKRTLTIHEKQDYQELPVRMLLDNKYWHDPVSERMRNGDVEIWELVNPTDDTHPIHLHLVRFQILDRRYFEPFYWLNEHRFSWSSDVTPIDATENGWKDIVRVEGKSVTRILVKFDGWPGRYAWHCHLLEHEANEMMRPFEIYA